MKVSVIVPAYNEGKYISKVLDDVLSIDLSPHIISQVIVANDASTDNTLKTVNEYQKRNPAVTSVSFSHNKGKTAAIRKAIPLADGDIIIIQDADLEYTASDYPALIAPIAEGRARVVYGSRFLDLRRPEGMRLHFYLANRLFTTLTNLLYGAGITDEGTAYKVFDASILRTLKISSSRFGFCPEVTARLSRAGIVIEEVPVNYSARSRKEGKKPGLRDGLEIIWYLIKYRITD